MIRSSILTLFFALPSVAFALQNEKCEDTHGARREAVFSGKISTVSVEKFIKDYERCPPSVVSIRSSGGEVEAAMVFGDWIHKNGIDINIPFISMSSCANYVFPAAKNKTIGPRGLVV